MSDVRSGRGSRSPVLSRPHWFAAAPRGQPLPVPPPAQDLSALRAASAFSLLLKTGAQQRARVGQARRTPGVCTGTRGCRTARRRGARGAAGRGGLPALALGVLGIQAAPSGDPSCGRAHQAPLAAAAAQGAPERGAHRSWGSEPRGQLQNLQTGDSAPRVDAGRHGEARGAWSRPAPSPGVCQPVARTAERRGE